MTRRLHDALPTLAIMIGASVWGFVWYPMRLLASMGLTGTAASATTSGAACLFVLLLKRRSIRTVSWHWLLACLGVAAGVTSVGFVWGAIHGQVMRVLLLFYLTPAWTAVFAHFILRDRLTRADAALSFCRSRARSRCSGRPNSACRCPRILPNGPGSWAAWASR